VVKIARDFRINLSDQQVSLRIASGCALKAAHHFRRQCRHGFYYPASVAARTRLRQHYFETLASAFARHLHQSELGDLKHRGTHFTSLKRLRQGLTDAFAIGFSRHVNKIHYDNSADVAQSQLLDLLFDGFEIGAQYRFILVALAHKSTSVHIDCSQRFSLVKDQVSAGFEPDLAFERAFNLRLDREVIENRLDRFIHRRARSQPRHIALHELDDPGESRGVVAPEPVDVARE